MFEPEELSAIRNSVPWLGYCQAPYRRMPSLPGVEGFASHRAHYIRLTDLGVCRSHYFVISLFLCRRLRCSHRWKKWRFWVELISYVKSMLIPFFFHSSLGMLSEWSDSRSCFIKRLVSVCHNGLVKAA